MTQTNYSREQAADLLGISTRTLDRQLKSKKIKYSRIQGRVRIYQHELEKLADLFGKKLITEENIIEKEKPKALSLAKKDHEEFYKILYEDTKIELRETYKQLQGTNYKLGKLEEQLKTAVPLLEYKNKNEELEEAEKNLEKRSKEIEGRLKEELLNKWIFAALLFGLLAFQPILWILKN